MQPYYRYTRAEISLDALRHNLAEFRRVLPPEIKLMSVVKANAYGHGLTEIAEEAASCGVDYIAVAFLDEAIELRRRGITAPVLVLGYTPPEGVEPAWEHDIALTVFSPEVLTKLESLTATEACRRNRPLKLHLKIDSGMGRIGLTEEREAVEAALRISALPGVQLEGLYTHYACADETDKTYTIAQHERFQRIREQLAQRGIEPPIVHIGNSAAGIDTPELSGNMLRLGISMYGLYPSEEVDGTKVNLMPVMSLKTGLVHVKRVAAGTGISYGTIYTTEREETIGTLPIGYADGYSRMLSGKAQVLVNGKRTPVVGRICMDQCMVRIAEEDCDQVKAGDEVVLLGQQGGERISAEEIAGHLGTINYEVTCMISSRVPRVFIKNGQVNSIHNPFMD
ncbi:alanine racemase [Paenibacillus turpanensis]|uniref:alanine racemase n=1 Tax=Paenibacillus turpanensis TaxID=2689078 RepID=UPI00140B4C81